MATINVTMPKADATFSKEYSFGKMSNAELVVGKEPQKDGSYWHGIKGDHTGGGHIIESLGFLAAIQKANPKTHVFFKNAQGQPAKEGEEAVLDLSMGWGKGKKGAILS